jgi:hypothetical protein
LLAAFFYGLHHFAASLAIQRAGKAKKIFDRRTLGQYGAWPADELGGPLLLFGREVVKVAQDLFSDSWQGQAFALLSVLDAGSYSSPLIPGHLATERLDL